MANSNNRLKAYVRYDGTGRVIAGSLILQRFKPKVGNWVEIDANECCNYIPGSTTTTTTTAAPECFLYQFRRLCSITILIKNYGKIIIP